LPEGAVQGRRDRYLPCVHTFLGLPYATPPVGPLRFAPPAPCPRSDSWSPLDATGLSDAGALGAEFAEAARLRLDIWAPEDAVDRPVLFWLGGDAAGGPAGWMRRFGARLAAEHGVVVVAPDHRRGALGYLDLTALLEGYGNGNFGLLDQMEALTWVATHVRAFGGDPSAITVGGRGDGAHAAALLAGLPRTSPLVRRLVLPEGAPATPVQAPEAAARVAAEFLDVLDIDCGAAESLRDIGAARIARAEVLFRTSDPRSSFGLVAHDDIPFSDPTALLRSTATPVEVMVGGAGEDHPPGLTTWTVRRYGGGRTTEPLSTSVFRTPAEDRPSEPSAGRGSAVGAFVRTGDPTMRPGPDPSGDVLVDRRAGRPGSTATKDLTGHGAARRRGGRG